MGGLSTDTLTLLTAGLVGLFIGLHLLLAVVAFLSVRSASRERAEIHRELFGLVRRIEALTSHRREQMLKHYDGMLEMLSVRLPPAIAAQTSQVIVETESKILTRLAELEPGLRNDELSRQKMDELIVSMEKLEHTIVAQAAETVRRVMAEGRRSLLDDERYQDLSHAA